MAGNDDLFEGSKLEGEDTPVKGAPILISTSAVHAPTVYADGLYFATRIGTNIRLTFAETILEPAGTPHEGTKYRHVGTLVMPPEGFRDMMLYLEKVIPQFIFPEDNSGVE